MLKCGVNSQAQLHLYPVQGRVWLVNTMGLLLFRDAARRSDKCESGAQLHLWMLPSRKEGLALSGR